MIWARRIRRVRSSCVAEFAIGLVGHSQRLADQKQPIRQRLTVALSRKSAINSTLRGCWICAGPGIWRSTRPGRLWPSAARCWPTRRPASGLLRSRRRGWLSPGPVQPVRRQGRHCGTRLRRRAARCRPRRGDRGRPGPVPASRGARHGLRTLRAATSTGNAASQKVLAKAGFVTVGPAGPADLAGKSGTPVSAQPRRRLALVSRCCACGSGGTP